MAQSANLELVRVSKRYGTTLAVDAIDLRVPADGYCCLLGPSGCGKTSTLRMSAGHQTLSEGDILIGDVNVTDLPPAKRGTAMMFQSYALFPHLTCVDNVAFSLKMRGVDKAKRREQAMGEHNALPMELQALTTTVTTTAVSFAVIADALGAIAVLRKRQARHGSDAGQA